MSSFSTRSLSPLLRLACAGRPLRRVSPGDAGKGLRRRRGWISRPAAVRLDLKAGGGWGLQEARTRLDLKPGGGAAGSQGRRLGASGGAGGR